MIKQILFLPINLLFYGIFLLFLLTNYAVAKNTNEMIQITSDEQQLDLQSNKATFSGNVIVTRGSMRLNAATAIITQTNNGKQQIIEAFGNPVKLTTVLANGKKVEGQGSKLKYETAQKRITLSGNAYLKQEDNSIRSERIIYLIDQQKMQALGTNNSRVSTVLLPEQLKN